MVEPIFDQETMRHMKRLLSLLVGLGLLQFASPPSVRVFDKPGSFEFATPAARAGPGAAVPCPPSTPVGADIGLAGLVGPDAVVALSPVARLRAPELDPPKDRDFAIVLGPWFTTVDEAPAISDVTGTVDGARSGARFGPFDWESARRFAEENTRLRIARKKILLLEYVIDGYFDFFTI